jgi:hypothetical protein
MAKINSANFTAGIAFSTTVVTSPDACICSCIAHPHCLSVSSDTQPTSFTCRLFATYPSMSSQLTWAIQSSTTVLTDRILASVYSSNFTRFVNPTELFSNTSPPWIPVFQLVTGNNQSFLWMNSSNSTTLTSIPSITINSSLIPHWYSILIAQWYQSLYVPRQVALVFIVNRSVIFNIFILNAWQSNINTWFSSANVASTGIWIGLQHQNTSYAVAQMKPVYVDNVCTRSFNANFKSTTDNCDGDFNGYFFVYGGYKDSCIAAARNLPTVYIPSVFYSPTANSTTGSLNSYMVADALMMFVQ